MIGGVDPRSIERMTIPRLLYWHRRAVAWFARKGAGPAPGSPQGQAITNAISRII